MADVGSRTIASAADGIEFGARLNGLAFRALLMSLAPKEFCVQSPVLRIAGQKSQIFRTVIQFPSWTMVDVLGLKKFSAKSAFHDVTMLKGSFPVDLNGLVAVVVYAAIFPAVVLLSSLCQALARKAAKALSGTIA